MNKKKINHGLMITAILVAVFVAAALTPAKNTTDTDNAAIASINLENEADETGIKMIADNDIPLASAPYESGMNLTAGLILVSLAAIMSGIVFFEDTREKRSA